jgi:S1-C subfamily serine protease
MRRFIVFGPALIVLLTAAVTLFAAIPALRQVQIARIGAQVTLANNFLETSNLLDQINREVRAVSEATLPGVVHINVRSGSPRGGGSIGAGWFYDTEGHIVTNAHVVAGTRDIRVEFSDGRVRKAQRIGTDRMTDIAVLRVDPAPEVFPLPLEVEHPIALGDRVFAFGSPFQIRFSMSEGIVSGLGRSEAAVMLGMRNGYTNYIQTDAAMNPGNSGGPLVDVNGRVVGMNTAIANATTGADLEGGQSAGIGFAIPIETIQTVVQQLIDRETILRGYIGVGLRDLPEDREYIERELGFIGSGVVVRSVGENEPADRAGLLVNDVIVEINGHDTPTSTVLRSVVSVIKPGSTVSLHFWRDKEFFETSIQIAAGYINRAGNLIYINGSSQMSIEEIRQEMTDD